MRLPIVVGLLFLITVGCSQNDELIELRLFAMGTWVDLSLPQAAARDAGLIGEIEAGLRQFERDYYAWGDGELAELNRALSDSGQFEASAGMAGLLQASQELSQASGGAFDPGVGALVELWGFDQAGDSEPEPPADSAIETTLADTGSIARLTIGASLIEVEADQGAANFTLDLGGIAKGAIVDWIVATLEANGVARAIVNAGGDLRVIGEPAARSWRIGIQAPRSDGLLGTIRLGPGEAAFSSGDYERYYERDGERMHHILDPRTGRPVTHTQAVTVIADSGQTADAAATALFVLGPDDWRTAAVALSVGAVLRVDASGTIEMNQAMRERFQLSAEAASDIIAGAD